MGTGKNSITYSTEEINEDLDKVMEYKEKSFKLYTEIKGLIVAYKDACQKNIDENNKKISELLKR